MLVTPELQWLCDTALWSSRDLQSQFGQSPILDHLCYNHQRWGTPQKVFNCQLNTKSLSFLIYQMSIPWSPSARARFGCSQAAQLPHISLFQSLSYYSDTSNLLKLDVISSWCCSNSNDLLSLQFQLPVRSAWCVTMVSCYRWRAQSHKLLQAAVKLSTAYIFWHLFDIHPGWESCSIFTNLSTRLIIYFHQFEHSINKYFES